MQKAELDFLAVDKKMLAGNLLWFTKKKKLILKALIGS